MNAKKYKCPVCEGKMKGLDLPAFNIMQCEVCHELFQIVGDGQLSPIGQFLKRNELGDDRVRSAISEPQVTTVKSFVEIFEGAEAQRNFAMSHAQGALRQLLVRMENRVDFAISKMTGLDMVLDAAGDVLAALREVRELISTTSARTRGIAAKEGSSAGPRE